VADSAYAGHYPIERYFGSVPRTPADFTFSNVNLLRTAQKPENVAFAVPVRAVNL
jgi:hypothetical protein